MKCTLCHRNENEHPAKYKLVRWLPPMRDYACEDCYWAIKSMNPLLEGKPITEKDEGKWAKQIRSLLLGILIGIIVVLAFRELAGWI